MAVVLLWRLQGRHSVVGFKLRHIECKTGAACPQRGQGFMYLVKLSLGAEQQRAGRAGWHPVDVSSCHSNYDICKGRVSTLITYT